MLGGNAGNSNYKLERAHFKIRFTMWSIYSWLRQLAGTDQSGQG